MNGAQHKVVGIGFGIATCMVLSKHGMAMEGTLAGIASVAGSLLPDIDHDRTKIGRKRKAVISITGIVAKIVLYATVIISAVLLFLIIKQGMDFGVNPAILVGGIVGVFLILFLQKTICNSKTFQWSAKHRGIMHTLLPPAAILAIALSTEAPVIRCLAFGIFMGYLSHLFADMFTVAGCPILFPLSRVNIRIMRFKSEDGKLGTVAFFLAALACVAAYFIP